MQGGREVRFLETVELVVMAASAEPAVREVMQSPAQMVRMQRTPLLRTPAKMVATVGMARTAEMVEMAAKAAWLWVPALRGLMGWAVMVVMEDQLGHPATAATEAMGLFLPRCKTATVAQAATAATPERLGMVVWLESELEPRRTARRVPMELL